MAYYTAGVIGTYVRGAVTPAGFDISGSTVRASNFLMSGGTIRDTAGTLDISGGNIYISGTLTQAGGAVTADGFAVAVGSGTNSIAYSSNGSNWTGAGAAIFTTAGRGVAWNGSLWVAVGQGTNTIAYSSNGSNWTGLGTSIFSSNALGIGWNGTRWVAGGGGTNSLAYSSDGSNWTGLGTSIFSTLGTSAVWNGSLWVATGLGTNSLAYSSDGINWTGLGTSIFSTNGYATAWNGSLWVAVGDGTNSIAYSSNGSNWTGLGTSIFSSYAVGVAWNGSLWVAVGQGANTIAYSSDGSNWTGLGNSIFSTYGAGVAWNGTLWVATGTGTNSLAYSADGSNWTGLGTSVFSTGLDVASRRYVLPVIESVTYDASGGSVQYTGSLVGANSAASNQIGGVTLRDKNAIIGGYIRNALTPTLFDISGGNIYVSGSITQGGSASSSNLLVPGYIRNALTPTTLDISGGNISNSGTTQSANAIVSGYIRNALTATEFDISSGNIVVVSNSASTSIRVGLPQSLTQRGRIETGSGADNAGGGGTPILSMQFGGGSGGYRHFIRTRHNAAAGDNGNAVDVFTNNSATAEDSSAPGTSNRLAISMTSGGVGIGTPSPAFNLDVSGTIRSTANTSNTIGGVTLSNTNISNAGTTTSSNFSGTSSASNSIGGVTLSNTNLTLAGTITGSTANTSNSIGGVVLSNTNLTLAGTITGSTANTSNSIGGVVLSNTNISNAGTTTSSNFIGTSSASNTIGGVTLSNTNLTLAGTITGSTANTSNTIGGVTLSNTNLTLAGTITGSTANTNNNIGGVVLSNNNISNGGNIVTSGTLQFNTGDSDKLYWTTVGLMGSKVAHSAGWSVDMYAGSNGTNTGTFRFLRGATTGGGSAESLRITSNGQVGIGTVAPAAALDISSSSSTTMSLRNPAGQAVMVLIGNNAADTSGLQVFQSSTAQGFYQSNTLPLSFWTKGVQRVTIDQSGNVGIGTTAPLTRAHIVAASNDVSYGVLTIENGATFSFGNGLDFGTSLAFRNTYKNSGIGGPFVQGEIEVLKEQANDTPDSYMSFSTRFEAAQLGNPGVLSEGMRLSARGRLGIGTKAPLYRLDISEAPTAASMNLGTWPRMNTTSNFFWVRGHCNATVSTYRIRWNTTNSNVPNTNVMTWADNATHGSYFQILKSGIWSINYVVQCTGTGLSWVDASSSFSNGYALPVTAGVGDLIALGPATGNTLVTSFTGYLPSNSGKFYRFSSTQASTNGGNGVITPYLTIALLYETPDIVPTFFSP